FRRLLRTNFPFFVVRLFSHLHNGRQIEPADYIYLLCHELSKITSGEITRLIFNIPPRHLKTILCSVALPAWTLAHNPGAHIMIVAYSADLAKLIAVKIRSV